MAFLSHLLNIAGVDKAVSITLLARMWGIVGGFGTLFFVTRYLSPELQGYYYTFSSLAALHVLVELGLNNAILQFASHEMARLQWAPDGMLAGEPEAKRRLQSLMKFAFGWFGAAAVLIVAILLPAGILFFQESAPSETAIRPFGAWALVVVFTALALFVNAGLAIVEGCNKVPEVAAIRFAQMVASLLAVWALLAAGQGLYALAAGSCVTACLGIFGLYSRFRHFFSDLLHLPMELPGICWKTEIWPFQWRIAVSWASGYLIFQLFNPILFATHGPVAAGKMGMSLQIIAALNGAAMVWISTKAPLFGQLVAQHNRAALDARFKNAFFQSLWFLLAAILTLSAGLFWLQSGHPVLATRVLPPHFFAALCLVCLANHVVFAEAAYLRAHKQETFMPLSVINGLVTALLAILLIRPYSFAGAVAAYAFGAIVIGLFGGTVVFMRKRSLWSGLQ